MLANQTYAVARTGRITVDTDDAELIGAMGLFFTVGEDDFAFDESGGLTIAAVQLDFQPMILFLGSRSWRELRLSNPLNRQRVDNDFASSAREIARGQLGPSTVRSTLGMLLG